MGLYQANLFKTRHLESFDSEMAMTFGYHDLSRHFKILMFSFSLSKFFARLIKWFTMWENRFCTSHIVSPFCILNSSYSWMRACFLALLTSFVPSCVTSRMPHISFTEVHCDTLESSSQLKASPLSMECIKIFILTFQNW